MPFPGMLHSPSSFEVSKPSLAGISRCVQEIPALLVTEVHTLINLMLLMQRTEVSRVRTVGLNQDRLGGVFLPAPSALCGFPVHI